MKMISRCMPLIILLLSVLLLQPMQAQRKKKKSTAPSYPEALTPRWNTEKLVLFAAADLRL